MTQQKQRKQLILTDNKNIFTYCFQPIQCLQPNFKTDGIRTEKFHGTTETTQTTHFNR